MQTRIAKIRHALTGFLAFCLLFLSVMDPIVSFADKGTGYAETSAKQEEMTDETTPSDPLRMYKIKYETYEGIKFTGPKKIEEGSDLYFNVTVNEDMDFAVYANDEEILPDEYTKATPSTPSVPENENTTPSDAECVNYSYTIYDVQEDILISVKTAKEHMLNIIFVDEEGNELSDVVSFDVSEYMEDGDIIDGNEFLSMLTGNNDITEAYDETGAAVMTFIMNDGELFYETSGKRAQEISLFSMRAASNDPIKYDGSPLYLSIINPRIFEYKTILTFNSGLTDGDQFQEEVSHGLTSGGSAALPENKNGWQDGKKTFIGWRKDGETKIQYPGETVKYNWTTGIDYVNYTAVYGTQITYDPNKGTGTAFTVDAPHGTQTVLYDKPDGWGFENFSFMGWSTDPEGSVIYNRGSVFDIPSNTENITLYAIYDIPPITFTFMPNGADKGSSFEKHYNEGFTVSLPNKPDDWTKAGYTFIGWSVTQNANDYVIQASGNPVIYPEGSSYIVPEDAENVTMYGIWGENDYNATFYIRLDGTVPTEPGSFPSSAYTSGIYKAGAIKVNKFVADPSPDESTNKVRANLNTVPTDDEIKAVIEASGETYDPATQKIIWYVIKRANGLGSDGGTYLNVDGSLVDKSKPFLIYDKNGPQNEITGDVPIAKQYLENETATIEDGIGIQREGYTFSGWNTRADGTGKTYKAGDEIVMTADRGDVTLYAIWTPISKTEIYVNSKVDGQYGLLDDDVIYTIRIEESGGLNSLTGGKNTTEFTFNNTTIAGKTLLITQTLPKNNPDYEVLENDDTIYRINIGADNSMSYQMSTDNGISYTDIELIDLTDKTEDEIDEIVAQHPYYIVNGSPVFIFNNTTKPMAVLPETGGIGGLPYSISGVLLMACAVFLKNHTDVNKNKHQRNNKKYRA